MSRARTLLCTVLGALCLLSLRANAAGPPRAALEATLDRAEQAFREGAPLAQTDPQAAEPLLRESAAAWREALAEVQNGPLHYNLGNTYFLLGDLGRAIASYRRAERLMPHDRDLAANLAFARSRVSADVERTAGSRIAGALLFWRDLLPPQSRWRVFVGAWIALWAAALLRLRGGLRAGASWIIGVSAVAGALAIGSLLLDEREARRTPGAVVVEQAVGRKGPDGAVYEPSFTEPLPAGLEVTIVERRPGWMRARLADGRDTWLPESALEIIPG